MTATSGHSIKAIQAQLGHQSAQSTHLYAHLGYQAQLRLVEVNGKRRRKTLVTQPLEIIGRGDWIRTSDLMLPKHAHYQAVLHPET